MKFLLILVAVFALLLLLTPYAIAGCTIKSVYVQGEGMVTVQVCCNQGICIATPWP